MVGGEPPKGTSEEERPTCAIKDYHPATGKELLLIKNKCHPKYSLNPPSPFLELQVTFSRVSKGAPHFSGKCLSPLRVLYVDLRLVRAVLPKEISILYYCGPCFRDEKTEAVEFTRAHSW